MSDDLQFDTLLQKFAKDGELSDAARILAEINTKNMPELGLVCTKYFLTIFPKSPELLSALGAFSFITKNVEGAYNIYQDLSYFSNISEKHLENIHSNQTIIFDHSVKDRFIQYNSELVQKIVNKPQTPSSLITFTITSCKRYDLFEKTINSFLNCADIEKIDKWFCVDDNSSVEDRKKMKEKYPFFQFYFKTFQEKGHPQSMNLILQNTTTPYIFHMEDDWQFFVKRNYIEDCLNVLSNEKTAGQCLINKNYSEVIKDHNILGGIQKQTHDGLRYYIHEQYTTDEEREAFTQKYKNVTKNGDIINAGYWPHFSFRPSLIRKNFLDRIGSFNEKVSHFEMEYAIRYKSSGFISTFLEGISCIHIGRLTSERGDESKLNAYVLNGEKQLVGKEAQLQESKPENHNFETYVINLKTRPDRMETFIKNNQNKIGCFTKYFAVDGSKLQKTEQLQRIFDFNDYNMREGLVGCAMSHIDLYIKLLESDKDFFCILEDDIELVYDYEKKLNFTIQNLPQNWDICFLGHHLWPKYTFPLQNQEISLEKWDTHTSLKFSMGGTGGYLISKKGAKLLLEFINLYGMTNGIDTVQQKSADFLDVYYVKPHLFKSECFQTNPASDTDIQKNYNSLTIPVADRVKYYEDVFQGDLKHNEVVGDFPTLCRYTNKLSHHPNFQIETTYTLKVPTIYKNDPKNKDKIAKCYFERLKIDGKFNISDALSYKEKKFEIRVISPSLDLLDDNKNKQKESQNDQNLVSHPNLADFFDKEERELIYSVKTTCISLGDNAHVFEAIRDFTIDGPFNKTDGGSLQNIFSILSSTLRMEPNELNNFLQQFFEKGKFVPHFKNTWYNIEFPHDSKDQKELVKIYTERFLNLKKALLSGKPLNFIYCTRWAEDEYSTVPSLINLLQSYNKNAKLFLINVTNSNIKGVENLQIDFPEHFKNQDWNYEKVKYDQEIFRKRVEDILRTI